ncbi:glycoside hydrolase family 64 protein [Zasmidium cellare ATCC 36951]|uniref:Glycoside hydrolase family 64 protein n=1 Tax=Zasmidium cellare ATCC 36951 TaxID=1080233 RepID=A0A6A6C1F7_ZASCE|nr:glycoside hydrolase family 64 protein [Zasmidium cellare ATCC 36951]KAF2160884.1 glycoside hydrolase family 64 protein [Zasmidium cellare ATCC 36951]
MAQRKQCIVGLINEHPCHEHNLPINIVNKWNSNNIKVYISGLDTKGALVMLGKSGQWVYPTTSSSTPQPVDDSVAIPLGKPNSTLPLTLPGYLISGRIWIAVGGLQFFVVATPNGPGLVQPSAANQNDPSAEVNYAFAELTWNSQLGIYADITAVDFVGLPLGIKLKDNNGTTQSIAGTPANAAEVLCDQLKAQKKKDGRGWDQLCVYNSAKKLIRVLSPSNLPAGGQNPFGTYFAKYVDDVWNHYSTNDLIINTQSSPGNVTCRTKGDKLQCAGDNRGYAKPNNRDIFGCNTGPFSIQQGDNAVHLAVVPRLCAAFNRATLLVPGGNVQPSLPPSKYYVNDSQRPADSRPRNWYSQLVHQIEVGGRGYAFSYDDVAPSDQEDQSGLVASPDPKLFTVIVGTS